MVNQKLLQLHGHQPQFKVLNLILDYHGVLEAHIMNGKLVQVEQT
jgi:hypothetical protein